MQLSFGNGPHRSIGIPAWGMGDGERAALDRLMFGALARCGPTLAGPATRVLDGGKGLRPAVTIAAAGRRGARVLPATLAGAAAVELLHWATLVHDDLLDDARSRHGQPTVNAQEGVGQAVVTGDVLIGVAFQLIARVGVEAVATLAATLTELCVGQTDEARRRFDPETTAEDVRAVARSKTGSLLSAAARIGGQSAGFDAVACDALATFGLSFGVSLQLLDDVLDLVSSSDRLGKPVGVDFVNGTMTMPAVIAIQKYPELAGLFRPGLTATERNHAIALLRDGEAIGGALDQARTHAELAAAALDPLVATRPHLAALAAWPAAYLDAQLAARVAPGWQSDLDGVRGTRQVAV